MDNMERDVVVSSRVRLARNYRDIPFAPKMTSEYAQETLSRARRSIEKTGKKYRAIKMSELTQSMRKRLVEHHLISWDLLKYGDYGAAMISPDETVSIMINEEDHLRIQALFPGMRPEEAARAAFQADEMLCSGDDIAFDSQLGYLTACPTNLGTGMRASTMLHLPAVAKLGRLGAMLQAVSKLGFTVRGIYGEGSEALGNLYQLSNQVTLGRSEEDTIKTLVALSNQIIELERKSRETLLKPDPLALEDRLMRSYGQLANARVMTGKEFMLRASDVRLASAMGYIDIDAEFMDRLMMDAQDGSIATTMEGEPTEREINAKRADIVREKLRR